jgi:acyl-coenzyme A thioesterase PaaI-like protein
MDLTKKIDENSRATIPLVATLGIVIEEVSLEKFRAVAFLPDRPEQRNHVGGPHAGAIFTMAETASGAVVQALFSDFFSVATPLIMNGEITYRALALGDMRGVATMRGGAAALEHVRGEVKEGRRPEFFIDVAIESESGTTGALVTHWTLKPRA